MKVFRLWQIGLCQRNSQLPGYPVSKYPRKQAPTQNKAIRPEHTNSKGIILGSGFS